MKRLIPLFALLFMTACSSHYAPTGAWQQVQYRGDVAPRTSAGLIQYQDKFYAIGGRGNPPVMIYDPLANQWTQGTPPPYELHHFQPVRYKDAIIIAGAMTGPFPNEIPASHLFYYYPKQDKWVIKEAIPTHRLRGSCGAVIHDDKLYLISGIRQGHLQGHVPWLDEFDLETRQWRTLANAPRSRDHFQAAVVDDKLYAIGGRNSSHATGQLFSLTIDEVDVYDFDKERWLTLPSSQNIPTPRANAMTLVISDEIWLLGGENHLSNKAQPSVEAYLPHKAIWQQHPPLNQGRHSAGALYFNHELWMSFGSTSRGETQATSHLIKVPLKN